MLDKLFFLKKFVIGLTLLNTVEEYKLFLKKYSQYIDTIFFSLPLGDSFHTRRVIKECLNSEEGVNTFWEILDCINKYDIKLELVLNTNKLTGEDIKNAAKLIFEKNIKLDKICFLHKYYNDICKYFGDIYKSFSFNNFLVNKNDLGNYLSQYDEFILGRDFIRDKDVFAYIQNNDKKTVLLINNACSFNCPGCYAKHNVCRDVFNRHLKQYNINYLYALQSIMPFEIHEKLIDLSCIDYIKLNTRSNDLEYCSACLDSYIQNKNFELVEQNKYAYYLWAKLGYIYDYVDDLEINKILEYKKNIYGGKSL